MVGWSNPDKETFERHFKLPAGSAKNLGRRDFKKLYKAMKEILARTVEIDEWVVLRKGFRSVPMMRDFLSPSELFNDKQHGKLFTIRRAFKSLLNSTTEPYIFVAGLIRIAGSEKLKYLFGKYMGEFEEASHLEHDEWKSFARKEYKIEKQGTFPSTMLIVYLREYLDQAIEANVPMDMSSMIKPVLMRSLVKDLNRVKYLSKKTMQQK